MKTLKDRLVIAYESATSTPFVEFELMKKSHLCKSSALAILCDYVDKNRISADYSEREEAAMFLLDSMKDDHIFFSVMKR